VLHCSTPSSSWFVRLRIMKLFIVQFSPFSCCLLLLRSECLPKDSSLEDMKPGTFLNIYWHVWGSKLLRNVGNYSPIC
jgi:hypothetical protein